MQLIALQGIGEIQPGDHLADIIDAALKANNVTLQNGDLLAIAQKVVSKAESQYRYLDEVKPSEKAKKLALECDKDARLVQLILDESVEVLRVRKGVIVVQHRAGYVHANAGIDRSNLPESTRERVLLLPKNADQSCQALRHYFESKYQCQLAVLINDSAGRAWRNGTQGFAIGVAGFNPLLDLIGKPDRAGRLLEVTEVAVADELAAAASFLMGQADESCPVVLIRDAKLMLGDYSSAGLIRAKEKDLFR